MSQSEESSSSSPTSPSASASFVLKTVNPFDYIKGRSRLERPVDVVTSFREKLRLDENLEDEKMKKLFSCKKVKEFEKIFFESFHPVKDAKTFLSETFSEQKSSSRLMSPVVCSKVLEWSLKPENLFSESVALALINSGHVSLYSNSGAIIDEIIGLKSASLLLALLHGFTDLSDSGLTKLIIFLIRSESTDLFNKYESSTEFKFNENISVSETCFLTLLAMPKSVQLTKKYFVVVKESEIISILNRLMTILKTSADSGLKVSSKCAFKSPSLKQVIDWISVVIDSQYPLCLIQPNLLETIKSINYFINNESNLNSDLMEILPSIKEVRTTKSEQNNQKSIRIISSSYIIESSTI